MSNSVRTLALYTLIGCLALALVLSYTPLAFAQQSASGAHAASGQALTVPAHAVEQAPGLYALGEAFDEESGQVVEGYMIVHPRSNSKKPDGTPGGGNGKNKDTTNDGPVCYTYIGDGVGWKNAEPWVVNTANPDNISDGSIFSLLDDGIIKWEDAADGVVGNGSGVNIIGEGSTTSAPLLADTQSTDGVNEVYFDDLDAGTIGVTIVWGIFSGRPQSRQLVEWDQIYNTDYPWSDTGAPDAMDFESIATHELGHSVGMGDLYDDACTEQTMYGYGGYGETNARDLEEGDITGIDLLY